MLITCNWKFNLNTKQKHQNTNDQPVYVFYCESIDAKCPFWTSSYQKHQKTNDQSVVFNCVLTNKSLIDPNTKLPMTNKSCFLLWNVELQVTKKKDQSILITCNWKFNLNTKQKHQNTNDQPVYVFYCESSDKNTKCPFWTSSYLKHKKNNDQSVVYNCVLTNKSLIDPNTKLPMTNKLFSTLNSF